MEPLLQTVIVRVGSWIPTQCLIHGPKTPTKFAESKWENVIGGLDGESTESALRTDREVTIQIAFWWDF